MSTLQAGVLTEANALLAQTLAETVGAKVLVHCWAGQSRSVAVLCAYLIKYKASLLVNDRDEGKGDQLGVGAALQVFFGATIVQGYSVNFHSNIYFTMLEGSE